MKHLFSEGRRLIANRDYKAALELYLQARRSDEIPVALHGNIDFNIAYLRSRLEKAENAFSRTKKPITVGIVVPAKPETGLYRDAETIAWALGDDQDTRCIGLLVAQNLYKHDYRTTPKLAYSSVDFKDRESQPIQCTISEWLSKVDVLIILEALNSSLLEVAFKIPQIRQVLFMPNLEWAVLDHLSEDTRPWELLLREAGTRVVSLARSPSIYRRITAFEIPTVLIPWSIPDPVVTPVRRPLDNGRPLNVLFNGGNLGFRDRRGLDIVVEALRSLGKLKRDLHVVIKCNKHHSALESLPRNPQINIVVDTEFLPSRDDLLAYYDCADLVLYPSRFEGLGLSLLEALHRGCYVLATDGDPMSDLVPPEFIRIAAQRRGMLRLASVFEPDPQSLVSSINQLLQNPTLMTLDVSRVYRDRQAQFRRHLAGVVRLFAR